MSLDAYLPYDRWQLPVDPTMLPSSSRHLSYQRHVAPHWHSLPQRPPKSQPQHLSPRWPHVLDIDAAYHAASLHRVPSNPSTPELEFSVSPTDTVSSLSDLSPRSSLSSPYPQLCQNHVYLCNTPLVAPKPLPYHSPTFLKFDDLPELEDDLSHPMYTQRRSNKRKREARDRDEDDLVDGDGIHRLSRRRRMAPSSCDELTAPLRLQLKHRRGRS
ncbi:hypothetical protein FISHEDRAFT_78482 [Fistulina hepatica ATCC 64428]|nr:hypothetical protein FISHEDRAFT_78482 [Fistulina hepatica ATCC 64428]